MYVYGTAHSLCVCQRLVAFKGTESRVRFDNFSRAQSQAGGCAAAAGLLIATAVSSVHRGGGVAPCPLRASTRSRPLTTRHARTTPEVSPASPSQRCQHRRLRRVRPPQPPQPPEHQQLFVHHVRTHWPGTCGGGACTNTHAMLSVPHAREQLKYTAGVMPNLLAHWARAALLCHAVTPGWLRRLGHSLEFKTV